MLGFFKPAEGCTVDQEDGTLWPAEGMDAPNTLFNRRRIACGDLIETDRPAEPPPEEPEESDPPAGEEQPETQTETPKRTRRPTGDK
jgi:hypothetical protein